MTDLRSCENEPWPSDEELCELGMMVNKLVAEGRYASTPNDPKLSERLGASLGPAYDSGKFRCAVFIVFGAIVIGVVCVLLAVARSRKVLANRGIREVLRPRANEVLPHALGTAKGIEVAEPAAGEEPRLATGQKVQCVMDAKVNVPAPKPVNLIHWTGRDYGRVTLTVTRGGMKITTVALDSDMRPSADRTEHEIEPKGSRTGLAFVLPPDTYLVISDLAEVP